MERRAVAVVMLAGVGCGCYWRVLLRQVRALNQAESESRFVFVFQGSRYFATPREVQRGCWPSRHPRQSCCPLVLLLLPLVSLPMESRERERERPSVRDSSIVIFVVERSDARVLPFMFSRFWWWTGSCVPGPACPERRRIVDRRPVLLYLSARLLHAGLLTVPRRSGGKRMFFFLFMDDCIVVFFVFARGASSHSYVGIQLWLVALFGGVCVFRVPQISLLLSFRAVVVRPSRR